MNRLDDMNAWRIFCEVVRSEGLNAGSERLGCEPSTTSMSAPDSEQKPSGRPVEIS